MLTCIRCLKYSWVKNLPLCTKCAQRLEIPSITNQMKKALESLPKVTLDEILVSANKRILAFEHYDLLQHFNSERIFMEYLSLVEVQKRTGDKIDLDIIEEFGDRWQSLNYALTYESEEVRESYKPMHERRIEPYRETDDEWVDSEDDVLPVTIGNVYLEEIDDERGKETDTEVGEEVSANSSDL